MCNNSAQAGVAEFHELHSKDSSYPAAVFIREFGGFKGAPLLLELINYP